MRRFTIMALAGAALSVATPALASSGPAPTPSNDPCSYMFISGALACQGYYGNNLLTTAAGSLTTSAEQTYISLLLGATPTSTGPTWAGPYSGLLYPKVLDAITGLSNSATLNFSTSLSGLTVLGAHFGNTVGSTTPDVTAFWLIDLGKAPTSTITLSNGQGSSNAQIFETGGVSAVPEPATWALMLFGFGAMGAQLRRRRPRNLQDLRIAKALLA